MAARCTPCWLLGLFVLSLPSCQKPAADDAGNTLKVALLLAGPENDGGWNQAAYEGLQDIKTTLGAKVRKITARTPTQIGRAYERAVAEDYDLVIGHGVEFNRPAALVARGTGSAKFVTTGGSHANERLATIVLRLEEAAYQLGIIAAGVTQSGVVSALSGQEFEPVRRVVNGLREGAHSVNPDILVLEEYLGTWEDSALAKEKALAHAARDADVFFQNADAAGAGIFEACRREGTIAFGCNRDQTPKAPDVILASAVADIPAVFLAIAEETAAGRFRGGKRSFGMREGKVSVVINARLQDQISAETWSLLEQSKNGILDGSLKPGDP